MVSREMKNNVQRLIADVLGISTDSITNIIPFGGMTNLNYRATIQGEDYVVRVPGAGTDGMINRKNENDNALIGYELGINVHQLYFNEETGVKITKYITGAQSLTRETAALAENMKLVADVMRALHRSGRTMKNHFNVFDEIERFENLVVQKNGHFIEGYESVKEDLYLLKSHYESLPFKLVTCHIDPVAGNLIKSGDGKMYLIDWEYSGMGDPLWDVGAYIEECGLSASATELLLYFYFQREATSEEQERILLNHIFQDFLWSLWARVKEADGEDMGAYGHLRLKRAKNKMAPFLEMLNNEDVG